MPYSSSMKLFLILFLLILSRTQATPASPLSRVRALQADLSQARRHLTCRSALVALHSARRCRYAGLSPVEYLRLRRVCKTRSESRTSLTACTVIGRTACLSERRLVQRALKACLRIGWDASGVRRKCPSVADAKKELRLARTRRCPPAPTRGVRRIESELKTAVRRAASRLGLRPPAYPLRVVESRRDVPDTVVVLLHGAGFTNTRLVPFAQSAVDKARGAVVRFVLPQAPTELLTSADLSIPIWYDVVTGDLADGPWERGQILRAARNVHDLIRLQTEVFGIGKERVFVAGFSQGGSVAATVYMRYRVAAAILVSSFLPMRDSYPAEMTNASAAAPVIMFQGTADETLPVEIGRKTRDTLKRLGRDVRQVEYPGEKHALVGVVEDVTMRAFELASEVLGTDIRRV